MTLKVSPSFDACARMNYPHNGSTTDAI
jgi:hypothetical protein